MPISELRNYAQNTQATAKGTYDFSSGVQDTHARFQEAVARGNVYSIGMGLTAINNATFTVATTGVTATPILGVWNPGNSLVNLVIWQAGLSATLTALTATGPGGFSWMTSSGNLAISTGAQPLNRRTLQTTGSNARGFASSPALTGMTGTLAVQFGSALNVGQPYNVSEVATAAGFMTQPAMSVENFDGSLFVPPGFVLALMANTTTVAHSVAGYLLWEEVPLTA